MVKPADRYNNTSHKFEFMINSQTIIEEHPENNSIPKFFFNIKKVEEIANIPNNTCVDVLCFVQVKTEPTLRNTRNGEKLFSTLTLKDSSGLIEIGFWGENNCSKVNGIRQG